MEIVQWSIKLATDLQFQLFINQLYVFFIV